LDAGYWFSKTKHFSEKVYFAQTYLATVLNIVHNDQKLSKITKHLMKVAVHYVEQICDEDMTHAERTFLPHLSSYLEDLSEGLGRTPSCGLKLSNKPLKSSDAEAPSTRVSKGFSTYGVVAGILCAGLAVAAVALVVKRVIDRRRTVTVS